jgi:hypothetical protein
VELPLDLTSPRPNPDIGVTIRAIQSHVKHIAAEKDPVARRGHALVLIEQWTSRFLEGAEGLARAAKMVRLNAAGPRSSGALLLIDPRGYSRSRGAVPAALVLGAKEGVAEMIALADDLSAGLGIRLAVTTLARLIDSH